MRESREVRLLTVNDAELLSQFEDCTLPFERWTHEAHVRVGYLYVRDHGLRGALSRLRAGLKAYNAANAGLVKIGYHETITVAFLTLIAAALTADGSAPPPDSGAFLAAHLELLDKHTLDAFYSDHRLFGPGARESFVRPDLAPLPETPEP